MSKIRMIAFAIFIAVAFVGRWIYGEWQEDVRRRAVIARLQNHGVNVRVAPQFIWIARPTMVTYDRFSYYGFEPIHPTNLWSDITDIQKLPTVATILIRDINPDEKTFQALDSLKQIEYVKIELSDLDDERLQSFAALKHMRKLSLSLTKVTRDGVERLRTTRPDLEIIGP